MEASRQLAAAEDRRCVILNLGCGDHRPKDDEEVRWILVDKFANEGVHIVTDLEQGLPMVEDESIDLILASHILEHLRNWHNLMAECHRVLKPKGILYIRVPEGRCRAAYADPTHVNLFAPETWHHFAEESELGFDSLGMRHIGFRLKWLEVIKHLNPPLDDGQPGGYFTEIIADLEKTGEPYEWEEMVDNLVKAQQEQAEAEMKKALEEVQMI